jgi:hypothetical protein
VLAAAGSAPSESTSTSVDERQPHRARELDPGPVTVVPRDDELRARTGQLRARARHVERHTRAGAELVLRDPQQLGRERRIGEPRAVHASARNTARYAFAASSPAGLDGSSRRRPAARTLVFRATSATERAPGRAASGSRARAHRTR